MLLMLRQAKASSRDSVAAAVPASSERAGRRRVLSAVRTALLSRDPAGGEAREDNWEDGRTERRKDEVREVCVLSSRARRGIFPAVVGARGKGPSLRSG